MIFQNKFVSYVRDNALVAFLCIINLANQKLSNLFDYVCLMFSKLLFHLSNPAFAVRIGLLMGFDETWMFVQGCDDSGLQSYFPGAICLNPVSVPRLGVGYGVLLVILFQFVSFYILWRLLNFSLRILTPIMSVSYRLFKHLFLTLTTPVVYGNESILGEVPKLPIHAAKNCNFLVRVGIFKDDAFLPLGFGIRSSDCNLTLPLHVLEACMGEDLVLSNLSGITIKVLSHQYKNLPDYHAEDVAILVLKPQVFSTLGVARAKFDIFSKHMHANFYVPIDADTCYLSTAKMGTDNTKSPSIISHRFDTIEGYSGLPLFQNGKVVAMHLGSQKSFSQSFNRAVTSLMLTIDRSWFGKVESSIKELPSFRKESDQIPASDKKEHVSEVYRRRVFKEINDDIDSVVTRAQDYVRTLRGKDWNLIEDEEEEEERRRKLSEKLLALAELEGVTDSHRARGAIQKSIRKNESSTLKERGEAKTPAAPQPSTMPSPLATTMKNPGIQQVSRRQARRARKALNSSGTISQPQSH